MTIRAPLSTRVGPRERSVELLTWVHTQVQSPTTFVQRPRDWPNPKLKPVALELRTWTNGLPPGVVANPVPPIRDRLFPNPPPQRQNLELRTWVSTEFLANVPPRAFVQRQSDWPNPVLAEPNYDLRGWLHTPQQTGPRPFSQSNWPNPILRPTTFELRTWVQALPPGALAFPLRQSDWPNPVATEPNFDLRGWSQSFNLSASAPTVPVVIADTVAPDSPSGGYFWVRYEEELCRRRAEKRRRDELAEATAQISDPTDREIARFLRAQEEKDQRRAELERLRAIAIEEAQALRSTSERTARALDRAIEKATFSAAEALDRQLRLEAQEDEELLLLAASMLLRLN